MTGLTRRQLELLVFLQSYVRDHGYTPSYSEIAAGIGLSPKSISVVHGLIGRLTERGYIERLPHKRRAIGLTQAGADLATKFSELSVSRSTPSQVAA